MKLDIVALQEIENDNVLKRLQDMSPMYRYRFFYKRPHSPVGLSLLSVYPIVSNKMLHLPPHRTKSRDIIKSTIQIDGKNLIIFSSHFRSKRAPESRRVSYAITLMDEIKTLKGTEDYIIVGDLNSNYNEHTTIRGQKKLNDTNSITGINHILNTIYKDKFVTKNSIQTAQPYFQKLHYNTWLDIDKAQRYSYKFGKRAQTPDNILLPSSMFDNFDISYVDDSFSVFRPTYLVKDGKIDKRYSDHLPIFALFDTKKRYKKSTNKQNQNSISYLYDIDVIEKPIWLHNITVIYRSKHGAIVQDKKGRAIYLYKCHDELKLGHKYDMEVEQIKDYYGLLEITKISNTRHKGISDTKPRYIDTKTKDIKNIKYQNQVIDSISGIYKKKYLHYKHKGENRKIRLSR